MVLLIWHKQKSRRNIYQSTGISDGAVTIPKLGSDIKFNLNLRINDKDLLNIYNTINIDLTDNVANISISSNGKIDGTSYQQEFQKQICII